MPDLLVSVADGARLGEALRFPQLERLTEDSLLFVMTIRNRQAVMIAAIEGARYGVNGLEGGFTRDLDHVVTKLLPLLGCPDGDQATWAATPRVLTVGDVTRLRHALGVYDLEMPGAPEELVEDDTLRRLREAVWAEPEDDHLRSVYADALHERGDPRGTLIALQLVRAQTAAPPKPREVELVAKYQRACIEPLAPYLETAILRRGFLAEATTRPAIVVPPWVPEHGAWSTVESLSTAYVALLTSPALKSLKRAAVGDVTLAELAAAKQPLAIEELVAAEGYGLAPSLFRTKTGIAAAGALVNLRMVSLRDDDREGVLRVMHSRLGQQLRHIEVVTRFDSRTIGDLGDELELSPWEQLALRFWLRHNRGVTTMSDVVLRLLREGTGREASVRIVVEVTTPKLGADAAMTALLVGALLRPTVRGIELRDFSGRSTDLLAELTKLGQPITRA